MFLLLFVQSNKQKNNKTPTLPSMLLCRSLEGQDGPLACSAWGDEPVPWSYGVFWVLREPRAPRVCTALSWEVAQSQGSAGGGSVASAAPAFPRGDPRGAPHPLWGLLHPVSLCTVLLRELGLMAARGR